MCHRRKGEVGFYGEFAVWFKVGVSLWYSKDFEARDLENIRV